MKCSAAKLDIPLGVLVSVGDCNLTMFSSIELNTFPMKCTIFQLIIEGVYLKTYTKSKRIDENHLTLDEYSGKIGCTRNQRYISSVFDKGE